ncbi:uncharacterized protein LOC118310714 isoform X2 [Scophthalmus maximus]|uniref:uncharacterized protein LOC118310714 isoform X2 n=1 Tax=Scophthalmus maximus TaxID=52904 RepID=UPI001FA8E851|nr:uncharacterized protein LOC118310714 isoform X2 [Scophthalmus maximus]
MEPLFRRRADGSLNLTDTSDATKVKEANRGKPWMRPVSPEAVLDKAKTALIQHHGDPTNRKHLLGFFEIQFGVYRGQTFKWVVQNVLGYAAYLVAAMKRDPTGGSEDHQHHAHNKRCLREYIELFPSGKIAIAMKEEQYVGKTSAATSQVSPPTQHTDTSSLQSLLVRNLPKQKSLTSTFKKLPSPIKAKPWPSSTLTNPSLSTEAAAGPSSTLIHSSVSTEMDDSTLLAAATKVEKTHVMQLRVCLPAGWIHILPDVDQRWISKTLFRWTAQGHPELDFSRVDKLWWYPPQVPLRTSNSPLLENYFGHPLLLWMPQKLWQVRLKCPHPECQNELLTSAGLHQKIRQVVGVGKMYFVASEYLACRRCKRKFTSWSHDIVSQLDIGHRVQFPCILTSKLACDKEVATLMRQLGLGNSSSQIQRKLQESHTEVWLQKIVQYLTECKGIASAVASGLILPVTFEPAPAMLPVPKHQWLMQVYVQDILQRLNEIKATITSQYGRILKIDSTKKFARKLAGRTYTTWATNVGNENGQVIMSVLTASEGSGLGPMIEGLINRYRLAGVAPPEIVYVDRDCCGNTILRRMFEEWEQMTIRLDIWHFMQRIAVGCTTDSHKLYANFMSRLSHCIFMWDEADLTVLKMAKRAELEAERKQPSEADVLRFITRSELALHCKRTTRGTKETQALIESLIQAFDGAAGRDTQGVPLINSARMNEIWKSQHKHVACIQDPPGVQFYTQMGTVVKGGHRLPTYRCARGSTSLESFHLHMNRFIPGAHLQASDTFFQAYLLDGLVRWNEARAVAATTEGQQPHSYNHLLRHAVNTLAEEVLGKKIIPYAGPRKYTGELIGVEYLYQQTGKILQDYKLAIEESETTDVHVEVDEGYAELEEFQDITVPTFDTPGRTPGASSQASAASLISSAPTPPATSSGSSLSLVPPSSIPSTTTSSLLTQSKPTHSSPVDQLSAEPKSTSAKSEESTSHNDSVGPDNFEGYAAVQNLAECLVGLRDHRLALTGEECTQIITLWQALGEYDKKKTVYKPRHQSTQGRFRATKKIVAPGVEGTKRCFIGAHSPAQWPDCDRVVEAIFTRLCTLNHYPVLCDGVKVARLYKHIRECIITNAKVMSETTIQLPEVNAATVTQWFSRRYKPQDKASVPPMSVPGKLPLAPLKKKPLHSGSLAVPHNFILSRNTAGKAKLKGTLQPLAISQALPPPSNQCYPVIAPAPSSSLTFILPSVQIPTVPGPSRMMAAPGTSQMVYFNLPLPSTSPPSTETWTQALPYTTQRYRKRKLESERTGAFKRKYQKKTDVILCKKCQKERKPPSHLQYFGNWYCEDSETQTYVDWRAVLEKRGYRKKKQGNDKPRY